MKRLVCEHQYYSNRERIVRLCNGKLQFNLTTLTFYLPYLNVTLLEFHV